MMFIRFGMKQGKKIVMLALINNKNSSPMISKTYRIEDIIFTELSPKKGSIEYFLVDTLGHKRKVTGIAKLGLNRKIKSVKAVFHREVPLIDALIKADVNQRISVDFSEFNEKYPRGCSKVSSSKTKKTPVKRVHGDISATMLYQDYYNDMKYQNKIKNILPDMSKLGVWLVFIFVIWLAFMAVAQMAELLKGPL